MVFDSEVKMGDVDVILRQNYVSGWFRIDQDLVGIEMLWIDQARQYQAWSIQMFPLNRHSGNKIFVIAQPTGTIGMDCQLFASELSSSGRKEAVPQQISI